MKVTVQWRVGAGGIEWRSTGETIYRDAILVRAGREQRRDITVQADGSVSFGPDKDRTPVPA